ncbi:MAG: type 4a pilus biogenesis protein PilO [Proteobacteria bacterium]|nr:type 4a pilus biogenesis protein PilO [Pseudomonadota bacterium]
MKKIELNKAALDPIFKSLEQLSKAQRLLICFGSVLLLIGVFYLVLYKPKLDQINKLNTEYGGLEQKLIVVKNKARELDRLSKEIGEKEAQFKLTMNALPDKKEIPSLLSNVSQSGQDAGLEFIQFQPKPEVNRSFFAEIPVKIKVKGEYHNVAVFFDEVSNLNRIVNIKNIKMGKAGKSANKNDQVGELSTECTAVTYRFIESSIPET